MTATTPPLQEGDIFYTQYDDRYHLYKLLRRDDEMEAFHVLCYEPVDALPGVHNTSQLQVKIFHLPMYAESFAGATYYTHAPVTTDELIGYHEYLRQMDADFENIAAKATAFYQQAYELTDEGRLEEAIAAYSRAVELIPTFHEAIDNRAFCKMDLGWWMAAIEDFRLSLQVHPDSLLAVFSIGECFLHLGDYAAASEQFLRCVQIDPTHQPSKDYLLKSTELLAQSQQDSSGDMG